MFFVLSENKNIIIVEALFKKKEKAEEYRNLMNNMYPSINHWVEDFKGDENEQS